MPSLTRTIFLAAFAVTLLVSAREAAAQAPPVGDPAQGKAFFQQNCALCHSDVLGPNNAEIIKEGPSLVGVAGRAAGKGTSFHYTQALGSSSLTWDAATLDKFLTYPGGLVPGTSMPISVADDQVRANLIAYLATLKMPAHVMAAPVPEPTVPPSQDPGAWEHNAPGVAHHLALNDLPAPYATKSIGNGPHVIKPPGDEDLWTTPASLAVPTGFTVKLFATHLSNPRYLRVAPNGDIFLAETGAKRIHVFRAADGADAPSVNQVFAADLDHPFGMAFYPPGNDPKWLYVADNNAIVRFRYHNGDLEAAGAPEVVVPQLYEGHGGHSTRDIAFSLDGKRMFISVGSGSNVAEGIGNKSPDEIKQWEAGHGLGAAWGSETNRADVLVTDPEGKAPLHTFATGIRNGVGIAVNPTTGDLWTSVNERDGLGDDLVPDYITRVKEGGYYGWPWYYLGNFEDPRWKGVRPDLAAKAIVPDVLLQSHSASLEMCFYTATSGPAAFPAEYQGDAFAAEHGSWNRTTRTGYKVIRVRVKDGVPTGEYDDFLTGFVVDDADVWGRPVGVAVARDGALLVSDDGSGSVWRVAYQAK